MSRTGWEHHDLEEEMQSANMAELLMIFKREDEVYSSKCVEFSSMLSGLTEDYKEKMADECQLQNEARQLVALRIAELLTNVGKR
ncbi:hypothetical protein NUG13_12240 [Bacillus subtilis]|uniref:hypothetical protein n=1 Tax=Bacillus subtilis TaxID=1423 RepID=UPI00214F6651|nr:hypothetical protein [Bacillus subtilis]MCR4362099.1 hypothetical protein [Bacillus subtilis]